MINTTFGNILVQSFQFGHGLIDVELGRVFVPSGLELFKL